MSLNKFYYKSLPELQRLAESYKTRLASGLETRQDPTYTVAELSREEFDNISTFLQNASVKDSKVAEAAESVASSRLSALMLKYFDEGLSKEDIVGLKRAVDEFNSLSVSNFYNGIYGYVFGVSEESRAGVDAGTFYGKIVDGIKDRISYLITNSRNKTEKRTAEFWSTGFQSAPADTFTSRDFFNIFITKSRMIEALVLLEIISFANKEDLQDPSGGGLFFFDAGLQEIGRDPGNDLTSQDYLIAYSDLIASRSKEFIFSSETAQSSASFQGSDVLESFKITDSYGKTLLTIPYRLRNSLGTVTREQYLFIEELETGTITFRQLISGLRRTVLKFVELIRQTGNLTPEYDQVLSYFISVNEASLLANIGSDVVSVARTIFYKDIIVELIKFPTSEQEKLQASESETSRIKDQGQLVLIDIRGANFDSYGDISSARDAFGEELGSDASITESGLPSGLTYKLRYTLLYKELNSQLRSQLLSDVQDYVFSRLLAARGYDVASVFDSGTSGTVSYDESLEQIYRSHRDIYDLFRLSPELSRYRFFYGNAYNSRKSLESEIIGYYVGDATSESSFTNNYGQFDYERAEISSFLDIYKSTRDYYYRVLLNKSFIQESAYSLYEKMFISWVSIERFVSSKIQNLRDPDFFNDEDIFNFLESYGLGVLNSFDFRLQGGKNYKTNIIKYFNQLTRLKGSKDVIPLLARVFDVDDSSLEINKFLLVDETRYIREGATELQISASVDEGVSTLFVNGDPTWIRLYDEGRIYRYSGSFVDYQGNPAGVPDDVYVFDEENYRIYYHAAGVISERQLVLSDNRPLSIAQDSVVFDETSGRFYTGSQVAEIDEEDITRVSFIDSLPSDLSEGDIWYASSEDKFYTRSEVSWIPLKVSYEYPSVVSSNVRLDISQNSSLSRTLSRYDGNYFAVKDELTGLPVRLIRYDFPTNFDAQLEFSLSSSLPRLPGVVYVSFTKALVASGLIARSYGVEGQPIEYSPMLYRVYTTVEGNMASVDIESPVVSVYDYESLSESGEAMYIISRSKIDRSELKFVEVPYSSDNGTREILNRIESGVPYSEFIERNLTQNLDPYWVPGNVDEEELRRTGLDSVETKYLSLTVSENVYRNYVISRYLLSAIENLESRFLIDTDSDGSLSDELPVTSRILIDTGSQLLGEASIYDIYQAVKVLFKTTLKAYAAQGSDYKMASLDTDHTRYYGVSRNPDWQAVYSFLERVFPGFNPDSGPGKEFSTEVYKTSNLSTTDWSGAEEFYKFNLYRKTELPIEFSVGRSYKRDQAESGQKVLNDVAETMKWSAFSTHRGDRDISQENSGQFVLDMFEDLNTLRIEDGQNLWNYYLSKYYDAGYNRVSPGLLQSQISAGLPDRTEFYYKVIERMIDLPIKVFDGLLNESYLSESTNLTRDFVGIIETVFESVYTQQGLEEWEFGKSYFQTAQPASIRDGEYFYNTGSGNLFRLEANFLSQITSFYSGSHGIQTPANSSGEEGDYFLNTAERVLYVKGATSWEVVESAGLGDHFVDVAAERVLRCNPTDPALFTRASFENQRVQTYLSDELGILNGTSELPSSPQEIEDLVVRSSEKLLLVLDSLSSIFSSEEFMRIKLSLKESEQQTISFVETATKIFLSYTSQLYSSRYRREFRTQSETAPISEAVLHRLSSLRTDYVFYDESLDIRREE